MVYVDADELKWMPYVKKWMVEFADRMKPELQQYIFDLFERYVEDGLRFVSKKCSQIINQVCRATYIFLEQGSHKLWKSWKNWEITLKNSMHGKIMELAKT